jgi:hypothetical protein
MRPRTGSPHEDEETGVPHHVVLGANGAPADVPISGQELLDLDLAEDAGATTCLDQGLDLDDGGQICGQDPP